MELIKSLFSSSGWFVAIPSVAHHRIFCCAFGKMILCIPQAAAPGDRLDHTAQNEVTAQYFGAQEALWQPKPSKERGSAR